MGMNTVKSMHAVQTEALTTTMFTRVSGSRTKINSCTLIRYISRGKTVISWRRSKARATTTIESLSLKLLYMFCKETFHQNLLSSIGM